MCSSSEELFRKAAVCVLDGWTALQLAVEHGMGGPRSQTKAAGMIDSIVDLFKTKRDVDWKDVADLLEELMDTQFDTICDDESEDQVGMLLWEFYKECSAADVDVQAIENEIANLPKSSKWLSKCLDPTPETPRLPGLSTIDDGSSSQTDKCSSKEEDESMETEEPEPGWTQVTRKKRA